MIGPITSEKTLALIDRKWNTLVQTDNKYLFKRYRRLWEYIRYNPLCNEILQRLNAKFPNADFDSNNILNGKWAYFGQKDEERELSAFIKVHDDLTAFNGNLSGTRSSDNLYSLAVHYVGESSNDEQYYINSFYSLFLTPVLEYLRDNLEDSIFILNTLWKFKKRCEWFEGDKMLAAFESDTRKGEKTLQKQLYQYLFDQGIPIFVEPASPSGEIDFIVNQSGGEKCCCEVKVFDVPKGKDRAYIVKGVELQLLRYLQDHNEPIGYLIIFKTGEKDLRFNLETDQGVNYVDFGNKRIYLFVIDIFDYEKSVTARNRIEPVIISRADFLHQS